MKKAEEKLALALSIADTEVDTEVDAVVDVAVAVEDTPLPIPTAVALALAVFENPPSVERDSVPESADVDPLRSVLALFAVEIEAENTADVSGLLEITDAETLWLADTEEGSDNEDTDALGTKDVAEALGGAAVPIVEAKADSVVESDIVGSPPVSPNDEEPTADAEAALKLLRVTECEKPAFALSDPDPDSNAAETVELAKLGTASVEVSDSLVVVNVDCAALGRVLSL